MNFPSNTAPGQNVRLVVLIMGVRTAVACSRPESNLPTGTRSGDLRSPGQQAVWGATGHVARPDSAGSLTIALETPSVSRTAPAPLEVHGESLRFDVPIRGWTNTTCRAARRPDRSWRGACMAPVNSHTVGITMVPHNRSLPVGFARHALETTDGECQQTKAGRALVYTRPDTEAHEHLDCVTREAQRPSRSP